MHPVGFAWVAAGALSSCVDGEEGACPELDGEQLQYNVRGKPVNIDDSGFGLDECARRSQFTYDLGELALSLRRRALLI